MSKARNVGRQTSANRQSGRPVAWGYWLANTLVTFTSHVGSDVCMGVEGGGEGGGGEGGRRRGRREREGESQD